MSKEQQSGRRSEQAGMFHFMKEMGSALIMALIAIVYVIQAFKIPTGSMENSLLVGDFLLGLKFIYGAPFIPFSRELGINQRLPAIQNPKPGDVVIFKYPGNDNKDYIKRCVAGPGSTVELRDTELIVNGTVLNLPPKGKFNLALRNPDTKFYKPLYIPKKGDTFKPSELELREFLFLKHLIHQENPTKKVTVQYQLFLNGKLSNSVPFPNSNTGIPITMNTLHDNNIVIGQVKGKKIFFNLNNIDNWVELDKVLKYQISIQFPDSNPTFKYGLFLDGKPIDSYTVRYDNYFMMGDNRDNSLDSRYWGYLNFNYVKAKAFILYFSLDETTPYYLLPMKIRWERIGKLIRSWDGVNAVPGLKW